MALVDVAIRNSIHRIECDEGQEDTVRNLANKVSERVARLSQAFATASDAELLLMTALTLEDELSDAEKKQYRSSEQAPINTRGSKKSSENNAQEIETAVANALDAISEYVEMLVKKIEK